MKYTSKSHILIQVMHKKKRLPVWPASSDLQNINTMLYFVLLCIFFEIIVVIYSTIYYLD